MLLLSCRPSLGDGIGYNGWVAIGLITADLLGDEDWVQHYFDDMNRSRRAIGHTGDMSEHAVGRMELFVRE